MRQRFFVVKAWLGGVGLALGLAGVALDRGWVIWIGIALLATAFLLRFGDRAGVAPGGPDR